MSIQRFKECRTCGKTEPRRWTEADIYQCDECQADTRRAIRDMITQSEGHLEQSRRAQERLAEQRPAYLPQSVIAKQRQAAKAAQHRDPRAAQLARAMAQDPRPAARGTQQDPISDPMHLLNPLNPPSPISPLNPLNDWDDSSHRHTSASSEPSVCEPVTHHSPSYDPSPSYDSGDSGGSYTSPGGCD
ncbi:hypothetical protein [Escherichia phage vB-Eco-KMB41]|nr:hypothetical protein [Escherichia phage vB-Eco-KMB41]